MRKPQLLKVLEAHWARDDYMMLSHYESMRYDEIKRRYGLHSPEAQAAWDRYLALDTYLARKAGEAYARAGLSVTK